VSAVEIVVIGGGVGGLTAALALAQGGHRVQVLERAARFAQPGPALRLAPNATSVLARLGLLDQVLELGSRPRQAVLRDLGSGRQLARLKLGAPLTARYGAPYVIAGRADLLSLLADACEDADVELSPGRDVTKVEVAPRALRGLGHAVVSCADNRSYSADAVLGADGAQSALRMLLGNDSGAGCGDGWAAYRTTVPADALGTLIGDPAGGALNEIVAWTGPDAQFVLYPVRVGEVYEEVAVFRSHLYPLTCPYPRPTADPADGSGFAGPAVGSSPAAGWGGPEELDEAFSWAADPVRAAVSRLRQARCWRMLDRVPLRSWRPTGSRSWATRCTRCRASWPRAPARPSRTPARCRTRSPTARGRAR
jgi:2-polyprenyl-6-methoxyphenol hydroxylase-like FAD-dependent oxidoreductase